MTNKQFFAIRIALIIILSSVVSVAVNNKNYIIPIIAMALATLGLLFLKKKVKEVTEDERDYALAGHAARWTITAYCYTAVCAMFILLGIKDTNPAYEIIANTLSFSIFGILIAYSIIFKFYQKIQLSKHKKWYIAIGAVLIVLFMLVSLRVLSGEDNWICQNGQWVKHGQPDFPAPTAPCR
ncbi:MAG: DUF2178 domain-containing protein [Patescibacteria group bacterium]|nr:DUF2178 domain-containing protein [Patescibacteria group bacterium]